MFNKFRIGAAGVALISALGMTTSANAATADAEAKAEILQPLIVTKTSNLEFGNVAVISAGSVTVDTAGAVNCPVGVLVCSGTTSAAGFNIHGAGSTNVGITTGGIVALAKVGGGGTMVLSNLTLSNTTLPLNVSGDASFTVGGQIAVGALQTAGAYVGQFTATVVYQ